MRIKCFFSSLIRYVFMYDPYGKQFNIFGPVITMSLHENATSVSAVTPRGLVNLFLNSPSPFQHRAYFFFFFYHRASPTHFGFFTISFFMRSMASSDISWNSSSGKSSLHCDMLQNVSCLVSPPNGEQPVNSTYIRTPMDLHGGKKKKYSSDSNIIIIFLGTHHMSVCTSIGS